jgi:anti-sigma-K factor RskA
MNTQSLIEHTVLYTLGFLDDQEQAQYESALMAASPKVRAHVQAEARRMADLGDLLPSDQPDPELRDLVIAAVRAGMREQEVEQRLAASQPTNAPAGPVADPVANPVAGRITPESARAASNARRYSQPALPRVRGVHPVWRAAAIGLAGATIALTVISANVRDMQHTAAEGARIAQLYEKTGAEFVNATLFDANTKRVTLTPASTDTANNAVASVWHNPDWGSARLFVKNLRPQPGDEPYRLVVLDAEGNIVREVAEFRPTGEVQDISISLNLNTESRLAIYQNIQDAINAQPVLKGDASDL